MALHILPMGQLATQLPALQHPVLHGEAAGPHEVPHLKLVHACPTGQSVATLHPHVPLEPSHTAPLAAPVQSPLPLQPHAPFLQAEPLAFPVQSMHAAPDAPQVGTLSLPSHCPLLQQKPVPQVPSPAPPHALAQLPDTHVGV
jgi:hypothetical protein